MDLNIANKTALVTASGAGIGFSIAKRLAKENANVIIHGRSQTSVDAAIAQIKAELPQAKLQAFSGDLVTKAAAEQLFKQYPNIDILINNLGIYEPIAFENITDEDWLRIFEINVLSGIRLARFYFPKMLKKNWGRVIFISSEAGVDIPSEMIHYGMTKTAQLAVARGVASLTADTEVTVNSILVGPTRSRGVQGFIKKLAQDSGKSEEVVTQEFFKEMRQGSLLNRFINPDEVAATVAYFCSSLAAATNGAAIRSEGGLLHSIV